jgi:16S rRNA (guanine527-N7)-methyltransferase
MQNVKTELSLENLIVINSRVESFESEECFSQITTRAFADVSKTIELTKHLISNKGRYLLMKGDNINEENIENINTQLHLLKVPFVSENRALLEIHI